MATLGVSEVKERSGFRHDFLGIPDFHRFRGKGTIFRVPYKFRLPILSENNMPTVGDKTQSDHETLSWVYQDLNDFSVVFKLTPCDVGSTRK